MGVLQRVNSHASRASCSTISGRAVLKVGSCYAFANIGITEEVSLVTVRISRTRFIKEFRGFRTSYTSKK